MSMLCGARGYRFWRWVVLFVSFAVWSAPAFGHKVNLFAYVEQGQVKVEGYFSRGAKAEGADVLVYDGAGKLLLKLKTDERGECAFTPPAAVDLKLVIATGEGHRGEFLLPARELGAVVKPSGGQKPLAAHDAPDAVAGAPVVGGTSAEAEFEEIRRSLDEVRKSLADIQRQVAQQRRPESGPRARDVLGGLGLILGITGVAAWVLSRRPRRGSDGDGCEPPETAESE